MTTRAKAGPQARPPGRSRLRAAHRRGYVRMIYPAAIFVGLFSVLPIAGMLALSVTNYHLINGWGGDWGFMNFLRLFRDSRFINSIYVTLALSLGGVAVQLVLGTLIAVGLDQITPRWRIARGFFIIPFAVPHVAVALVWLSLFTPTLSPINAVLNLVGLPGPVWFSTQTGAITAIVIADTWANFPFVMLLILAALQGISPDLKEAAAIDGATRMRTFFVITLPLLKPALVLVTLFRFIETLKHFPLIYVMTKGGTGARDAGDELLRLCPVLRELQHLLRGPRSPSRSSSSPRSRAISSPGSTRGSTMDRNRHGWRFALGRAMMVVFLVFALVPVVWSILLTFRPQLYLFEPVWRSPLRWTLANFDTIARSDFPLALLNSLITAGGATVLAMIIGVPAGFALAKGNLRGTFTTSWALLLLRMAPPIGIVLPLFLAYLHIGLLNTRIGLIFAYMSLTLPFVVWSMWTSFAQVPSDLIEAAAIDGATLPEILWKVVLPVSRPGLIAAAILGFLLAWNDFFFALLITRGDTVTAPVAIMNFVSYASVDWGAIALATIILTLPIIPVILFANKYIVQSLGGAVKG